MLSIFPELWVLQRFKTANVAFSLSQSLAIMPFDKAIHDSLLVFHCNYVFILHNF